MLQAALLAAGVVVAPAVQAQADDAPAWRVGVGLKVWVNDWSSWDVSRVQEGPAAFDVLTQKASGTELSYIPVLTVRRGRWFGAVSHMSTTQYTLRSALGTLAGTRSEVDANVGGDLMPGLALTAGYKQLTQDVGGRFQWRGPTLAVNASAPLGNGWAVYGTYGLGRLTLTLPAADALGRSTLPADYSLGEWGVAHSFSRADSPQSASLVLALGYRAQGVKTRGYALVSQPSGLAYGTDTLRDFTQGLTLSLIGSF